MNNNIHYTRKLICIFLFLSFLLTGCQSGNDSVQDDNNDGAWFTPDKEELGPPIEPREGDFTIVILPDTQYYSSKEEKGGTPEMFYSQIDWIRDKQEELNIVYVAHVGDITDNGDKEETADYQWDVAKTAMYGLEYPKSIPYGVAVGNHDQFPMGYPVMSTTARYNEHFGVEHFKGRPYYGGNLGDDNDNHYDLFSAGGLDFVVVYIEYDRELIYPEAIEWADEIIKRYSSRKAILVSHFIIQNNGTKGTNAGKPGAFSEKQGVAIYEGLKDNPNLFMMVCGHVAGNGEGYREDTYNDHTVRTFLSNYQAREKGGNGRLRIYNFSVENNEINVKTYSPFTDTYETDGDSQFTTRLFD
ncbi:metallophosphoesterase [Sinomicrobium soli]|uniref:metallophosphoesterase n=1 Tax=Sinomicrobium sp. N-1-3-6 TaxID=2219864 RepID=UPI000DCE3492|nr:metallophosphoesterase [Sinomicrobium sp. N-1-3-6]RAV30240.1 hypothetical protein DN748_05480 [Sinomicrobium sp. N-1-3-6]